RAFAPLANAYGSPLQASRRTGSAVPRRPVFAQTHGLQEWTVPVGQFAKPTARVHRSTGRSRTGFPDPAACVRHSLQLAEVHIATAVPERSRREQRLERAVSPFPAVLFSN